MGVNNRSCVVPENYVIVSKSSMMSEEAPSQSLVDSSQQQTQANTSTGDGAESLPPQCTLSRIEHGNDMSLYVPLVIIIFSSSVVIDA